MTGSLTAVREVWAQRSGARSRGDLLYLLYLVVLSVLVLGVPALQAAGTLLARPDVLPALLLDRAGQLTTAVTASAAAGLVLAGAVRGPALLAPFFTAALASSGIPRRAVLWRPFLRAALAPVLLLVVIAALIGTTLASAGHADPVGAAWFVIAALGTGLLLAGAWLAGQLLGARGRGLLAAALLGGAVLAGLLPTAIGPGGAYPVGPSSAAGWAIVLLLLGLGAVAAGIPLLDRLRGAVLREQARRWETATVVATSGDLGAAAQSFRPPPSSGRRLRAVGPGGAWRLYARRDAVAWLRSPERSAAGAVAALLGAAALGGSTLLTGPLAAVAVLLGGGALWGGSGALVDGIRHAVHTLGAPRLFGHSAARQALLHTTAPMLLLSLLAALGGGGVLLLAPGAAAAAQAVLLPVLLVPVLIAARVRDAAKGPMPLSLMTPMPTPQGDLAVIPMLLWQSDALLLALAAAALLAGLGALGPLAVLVGAAALIGAMVMMARTRLRPLAG